MPWLFIPSPSPPRPVDVSVTRTRRYIPRYSICGGYRGNARLLAASVEEAQCLIVQLENRIRPLQAHCSVINVAGKKNMRLWGPETCKLEGGKNIENTTLVEV